MKIFVLFEKKSFGDGDCILAVSTSERKIKKAFALEINNALSNGFEETYRDDNSFIGRGVDNDMDYGEDYELAIETHETI